MAKLECGVNSCHYNESNACCRGAINVYGRDAMTMCDTCCGSYEPKNKDHDTNSFTSGCECTHPKDALEISCEATKCVYNDDCRCDAPKVGIAGREARDSEETECSTFRSGKA
ncbi:MAG TPA: DUF1540 domain-containing protein [Lachnospiraceae bacterium]|jgi:hypothetical protein|nr:DUF1540 domain-containing protein [Lachnospiraceae bacterium]